MRLQGVSVAHGHALQEDNQPPPGVTSNQHLHIVKPVLAETGRCFGDLELKKIRECFRQGHRADVGHRRAHLEVSRRSIADLPLASVFGPFKVPPTRRPPADQVSPHHLKTSMQRRIGVAVALGLRHAVVNEPLAVVSRGPCVGCSVVVACGA